MKYKIISIITFFLLLFPFVFYFSSWMHDYDKRLEGKWKSNKKDTVDWLLQNNYLPKTTSAPLKEKYYDLFGKLELSIYKNTIETKMDDWKETKKYTIKEKGNDFVIILSYSNLLNKDVTSKIIFVENGFWLEMPKESDLFKKVYREKFDKLK